MIRFTRLKEKLGLLLTMKFSDRLSIIEITEHHGGEYAQSLVMNDHPEPWESLVILSEKMKSEG